jgi:bacteriocin biosynthesis cyclodehydratase domain-containing protein
MKTLSIAHPRLRADFEVIEDGPNRAIFAGDQFNFFVESSIIHRLTQLLDGTRDVVEICKTMTPIARMDMVLAELARLERFGALAEGPAYKSQRELAFSEAIGAFTGNITVALTGSDTSLLEHFTAGLEEVGIAVAPTTAFPSHNGSAPLTVVLATDYLNGDLEDVNIHMLSKGQPWILCRPTTTVPWLGPLFIPGETACWRCLAYRIEANRHLDSYLRMAVGRTGPFGVTHGARSSSILATAGLLATLIERSVISYNESPLRGRLLSLDIRQMTIDHHQVVRRLDCRTCGDTENNYVPRRPELTSRRKVATPSSAPRAHRAMTVDEALEGLQEHISPITGIVTNVTEIKTGTDLFSTYAAGHSFATPPTRFDLLVKTMRGGLSGGKGRTQNRAKMGALGEAIERATCVYRGDERQKLATCRELAGEAADLRALLGFSDAQYHNRDKLNQMSGSPFDFIPKRIGADTSIEWTRAWSPVSERSTLIPSAYCYYGHPDMYKHLVCVADSNGAASGGSLEEAITEGFYELIERDSVALWWYNMLGRPAIDLDGSKDPYLDQVREYHASVGREVWALDLTSDSGIPAYAAISRRTRHVTEDIVLGFGCHLDPSAALDAAIDEMNQFMPSLSETNTDGSTRYGGSDPAAVRWFQHATTENQPYLLPDDSLPVTNIANVTDLSSDDLKDDVEECCCRARKMKLELYAIDLTRSEVNLAVARVVVPGLRHFWRRLGPGRLYDAPVAAGMLSAPLLEEELNPETVFF